MIIQCEQCQAKFKLDDSKVTDKGVKVRCAKCKHVFTVTKEQPATEPADFGAAFEQTAFGGQEEASFQTPAPPPETHEPSIPFSFGSDFTDEPVFPDPPAQQVVAEEPAPSFSFDTTPQEEEADNTVRMESNPLESKAQDSSFAPAGNDDFSLSSLEDDKGFAVERDDASSTPGEVDFDSFDFGDGSSDADKTMVAPPATVDFGDKTMIQQPMAAAAPEAPAPKAAAQGLDFSDDDMFGAVVAPPVEEPAESISFDFGTDSFADSMDLGGAETGQKGSSLSLDGGTDAPFSLGEIDFGDELTSVAVQQVNPDELKPSQEILFAPLAEAQEKPAPTTADDDLKKAFMADAGQPAQEDLPPLSISSRRKQSPLFTGLIAVLALLVVGVLAYFGLSSPSSDKDKVAQESGKISVRAVKASYVKNASAGALLVISGEALNEYPQPRAALQVKGMIYDAKGVVLSSKNVFGGNQLTDEQLATMPLDKIEAAMANQFGDSLANLEVPPGKAVPFTIVIANPPKEGKDFGVEPVGSTEAKGKQQ